MDLINKREFEKKINARGLANGNIAKSFFKILRVKKFNKFYLENFNKSSLDFINSFLEEFDIKYEISSEDLNKIPINEGFIVVSNHPFAGIDGMILLKIISEKRPDFKLLGGYLLNKIPTLHDKVFPFNPFNNDKPGTSNFSSFKYLIKHLGDGNSMGVFLSPYASGIINEKQEMLEERDFSLIKFIKNAHLKVVPVHFEGNSNKLLKLFTTLLPKLDIQELQPGYFSKPKKAIRVRIGNPILTSEQEQFSDISQFGRFLRLKTNYLGSPIEPRKFYFKERAEKVIQEIAPPVPQKLIEEEISKLLEGDYKLFRISNYIVFCAHAILIPNILNEIGRLREITFRTVGEGTNKSLDLDEYDLYYQHLFIWDEVKKKIAGAYRVGKGEDILRIYGKKGFYINTLFRFDNKIIPILKESIELGRSFIIEEYQQQPVSLFLLWKGILFLLLKNTKYRYLIGPVSISNQYSRVSKKLIIDFVRSNHYNNLLAKFIKPRNKFKFSINHKDEKFIFETTSNDIDKLDKFIKDLEPGNLRIPILFKKYLKLNGKIAGFNIDPDFNDALDGLLILDLFEVPPKTIKTFSKEINDEDILERFQNQNIETFCDVSKLLKKKKKS